MLFSNNLTSPANDLEKVCWGENLLGADVECEDLEDLDGYYTALGCKKISSGEDIGVALKKAKKGFFWLSRTHHPDKTENKEKIELFKKAKEQYELQKTAFETLGTLNFMGNAYTDQVIYERNGEELRSKFTTVFEERYPDSTFAQEAMDTKLEAEWANIFSKGQATRAKKKYMYAL